MKTHTDFKLFCQSFEFPNKFILDSQETLKNSLMPFKVTEYYAGVIKNSDPKFRNNLLNIIIPPSAIKKFNGRIDPYGNVKYRENTNHFIQHKYKKTLLIHLVDICCSNCQFCYKANEIRQESKTKVLIDERIKIAIKYTELVA